MLGRGVSIRAGASLGLLLLAAAFVTSARSGGLEVLGIAGCPDQDMVNCDGLSGKTHRNRGPDQITYMAPDGRLFLWIGDKIVEGRWTISRRFLSTVVCYRYEGSSADPGCASLKSELRRRDGTILGDPFELATRGAPPFRLAGTDLRNLNQMLADMTAQQAGRRHKHAKSGRINR